MINHYYGLKINISIRTGHTYVSTLHDDIYYLLNYTLIFATKIFFS